MDAQLVARFNVVGEPVPKGRPRFRVFGKQVRTYTPAKTVAAEKAVADSFRAAIPHYVADDGRYSVHCLFIRKSIRKTDIDNLQKTVFDALNGLVWIDDSQIDDSHAHKLHISVDGGIPRTEVHIFKFGEKQ